MLWRLLLLLHHCCCCNAQPAEDCSEEFRWLGNLFQLHVTALYNAQCWLRWEILRDFKTKWETNSDYIGTSSLWYESFLQERPKISFIFQVGFLSWSPEFSHIHISFIFKLRRNFFLKGFFCWTTFLWKATWTPYPGDKSFEQLFHIFWGDSHQTLQVG